MDIKNKVNAIYLKNQLQTLHPSEQLAQISIEDLVLTICDLKKL